MREAFQNLIIRNIDRCEHLLWVRRLEFALAGREENAQVWGFVCIRTAFDDDTIWEVFKEKFSYAANVALPYVYGTEEIKPKRRIQ